MPKEYSQAPKRKDAKPQDEDNGVLGVLKRGFIEMAESGALGSRRQVTEDQKKAAANKNKRGM